MKNNNTRQNRESKRNAYLLISGMVVIVFLIVLCVILSLKPTDFEIAKEKCGKDPIIASSFAASWSYDLPEDKFYNPNQSLGVKYFCTESEAQDAGYRHSPLGNKE